MCTHFYESLRPTYAPPCEERERERDRREPAYAATAADCGGAATTASELRASSVLGASARAAALWPPRGKLELSEPHRAGALQLLQDAQVRGLQRGELRRAQHAQVMLRRHRIVPVRRLEHRRLLPLRALRRGGAARGAGWGLRRRLSGARRAATVVAVGGWPPGALLGAPGWRGLPPAALSAALCGLLWGAVGVCRVR